jgi:hypothetical protein
MTLKISPNKYKTKETIKIKNKQSYTREKHQEFTRFGFWLTSTSGGGKNFTIKYRKYNMV